MYANGKIDKTQSLLHLLALRAAGKVSWATFHLGYAHLRFANEDGHHSRSWGDLLEAGELHKKQVERSNKILRKIGFLRYEVVKPEGGRPVTNYWIQPAPDSSYWRHPLGKHWRQEDEMSPIESLSQSGFELETVTTSLSEREKPLSLTEDTGYIGHQRSASDAGSSADLERDGSASVDLKTTPASPCKPHRDSPPPPVTPSRQSPPVPEALPLASEMFSELLAKARELPVVDELPDSGDPKGYYQSVGLLELQGAVKESVSPLLLAELERRVVRAKNAERDDDGASIPITPPPAPTPAREPSPRERWHPEINQRFPGYIITGTWRNPEDFRADGKVDWEVWGAAVAIVSI